MPVVLVRDLQRLLGETYGVDISADVCDFLITDLATVQLLRGEHSGKDTKEQLLIVQQQDSVDVALYLDEAVLGRLDNSDPRKSLRRNNLEDFWTVLEGISHFNYLAWNASCDKAITLMELEMQAEVDKYISARILLDQQNRGEFSRQIINHLFEQTCFYDHLQDEELERYQSASSFASRYCYSLESRFATDRLEGSMMQELRAFYRLPQSDKVSHICSAQLA